MLSGPNFISLPSTRAILPPPKAFDRKTGMGMGFDKSWHQDAALTINDRLPLSRQWRRADLVNTVALNFNFSCKWFSAAAIQDVDISENGIGHWFFPVVFAGGMDVFSGRWGRWRRTVVPTPGLL